MICSYMIKHFNPFWRKWYIRLELFFDLFVCHLFLHVMIKFRLLILIEWSIRSELCFEVSEYFVKFHCMTIDRLSIWRKLVYLNKLFLKRFHFSYELIIEGKVPCSGSKRIVHWNRILIESICILPEFLTYRKVSITIGNWAI